MNTTHPDPTPSTAGTSAAALPARPVPYDPTVEKEEEGEAKTFAEINKTMQKIRITTFENSGHAIRNVHAKSHGLLRGELRVLDGLPAQLAQGLFAKTGAYPVLMRLSTTPGDILDDNVSTPRGLAIKVVGVEGERLPGSEGAVTQDFVLVNGPAFNAPNIKKFLSSLNQLEPTTDKMPRVKKALSTTLQGVEKVIEAFGGKSATILSMGGQPETNPLGETYFSQAAIRFGAYIAKVSVAPVSDALRALTDAKVDLHDRPNGLRETVVEHFGANGGEWEVRVQLCTDLESMPIEDASIEWPEDKSPYVAVARITVPPQGAWNPARSEAVDNGMLFSPWQGLAAHRPLGAVMRARKSAYQESAKFRTERNERAVAEPLNLDSLPD